ncbi:hypothetical protein IU474_14405 [Nocardia otitidiscaviarum]|uniref:hypothetical protein n=1 Tax=Nocardia otitidiscaviarum TaxID=1823 RepID=UPI00189568CC|nr:hypothetical protein [Nocardia otitidiscaviarum]MBF6238248.1 hypothetical protein [Nocardia otitidiscaviarum]
MSNKGLAHRMRVASERDGGRVLRPSHSNIQNYRAGKHQPTARSLEVLLMALSEKAGRHITAEEIGYRTVTPTVKFNPWERFAQQYAAKQYVEVLAACGLSATQMVVAR